MTALPSLFMTLGVILVPNDWDHAENEASEKEWGRAESKTISPYMCPGYNLDVPVCYPGVLPSHLTGTIVVTGSDAVSLY